MSRLVISFSRWASPCLVVAVFSGPAAAEPLSCGLKFNAEPAVERRWPELLRRTREALGGRQGLDACAGIQISLREDGIALEVVLADGRSAARHGLQAVDVVPTLEALLGVPDEPDREPSPVVSELRPDPARGTDSPRGSGPNSVSTGHLPAASAPQALGPDQFPGAMKRVTVHDSGAPRTGSTLGLEIGAVTSARVGAADHSSMSLGLLGLAKASEWLLGFQGRVAEYAWNPSSEYGDSFGTLELGALMGRRARFDTWLLDVLAGPALSLEAGSTTVSAPAGSTNTDRTETSTTVVVPRLVFASHLTWNAGSPLRGFVGFEGEAGAGGGASEHGLPAWMLGVAVGAVLGQP